MIDKAMANMGQDNLPPQYETGPNAKQLPPEKGRQEIGPNEARNPFETASIASTSRNVPLLPDRPMSLPNATERKASESASDNEKAWFTVLDNLQTDLVALRNKEKRINFVNKLLDRCPSAYSGKIENLKKRHVLEAHELAQRIQDNMEKLSRIHPDPLVQTEWAGRAHAFAQMTAADREGTLSPKGTANRDSWEISRNLYLFVYRERDDSSGLHQGTHALFRHPIPFRWIGCHCTRRDAVWTGEDVAGARPLYDSWYVS